MSVRYPLLHQSFVFFSIFLVCVCLREQNTWWEGGIIIKRNVKEGMWQFDDRTDTSLTLVALCVLLVRRLCWLNTPELVIYVVIFRYMYLYMYVRLPMYIYFCVLYVCARVSCVRACVRVCVCVWDKQRENVKTNYPQAGIFARDFSPVVCGRKRLKDSSLSAWKLSDHSVFPLLVFSLLFSVCLVMDFFPSGRGK